jgi:hypothetical protein
MTREEFETALDERRLWIVEYQVQGRRNYLVRRNGRTKTWKTDPNRFEIPIKWKLRNTARINEKVELNAWFVTQPGPSKLVGEELVRTGWSNGLTR